MNFQLLNKKWSSFYNWTILYPSLILLVCLLGLSYFIFSSVSNWHIESAGNYMLGVFFGAYFGFIILGLLLLLYTVWFVVAADSIAKTLGWNRIIFNVLNLLAIFTLLYFITIIVLWVKVKDVFEENGFATTWTGKIKR